MKKSLYDPNRHGPVDLGQSGGKGGQGSELPPIELSERLWDWFGLSYASFLVLPRVLMHEMPMEWQDKMTDLLEEYENTFPNQPDLGTRVQAIKHGKLVKWPSWVLNYRRPEYDEIQRVKGDD